MLILLPDPTAATSQLYPGDRLIVAYGVLPNHNDSVTHTEHDQYGMISMPGDEIIEIGHKDLIRASSKLYLIPGYFPEWRFTYDFYMVSRDTESETGTRFTAVKEFLILECPKAL